MAKNKPQRPVLKLVPPSPWLQREVQGIQYWVHIPTAKCGIHIRGLARICGVDESVIQEAIDKAREVDGGVATSHKSDLDHLLRGKTILLGEVATDSSELQDGPGMVICSDVCADLIRYYAVKGNMVALKSVLAFMQFGMEQSASS